MKNKTRKRTRQKQCRTRYKQSYKHKKTLKKGGGEFWKFFRKNNKHNSVTEPQYDSLKESIEVLENTITDSMPIDDVIKRFQYIHNRIGQSNYSGDKTKYYNELKELLNRKLQSRTTDRYIITDFYKLMIYDDDINKYMTDTKGMTSYR